MSCQTVSSALIWVTRRCCWDQMYACALCDLRAQRTLDHDLSQPLDRGTQDRYR